VRQKQSVTLKEGNQFALKRVKPGGTLKASPVWRLCGRITIHDTPEKTIKSCVCLKVRIYERVCAPLIKEPKRRKAEAPG